jgi:hypothetical protein
LLSSAQLIPGLSSPNPPNAALFGKQPSTPHAATPGPLGPGTHVASEKKSSSSKLSKSKNLLPKPAPEEKAEKAETLLAEEMPEKEEAEVKEVMSGDGVMEVLVDVEEMVGTL